MATLHELKREARRAGVPAKDLRTATTPKQVRALIADASGNGSGTKARGKRIVKKAVAATKKSTARKGTVRKSASSTSAPATGRKNSGTAKRRATAPADDSGRNLLGNIDWRDTDGWNPRDGSVPDIVVKALRKAKGDRERTFNALIGQLNTLVPVKTRNNVKRSKSDREQYLRYLIARNAWAFAIATGQHEKAENRAEYGSAGTGNGTFKRAGARRSTAKAAPAKKPAAKKK